MFSAKIEELNYLLRCIGIEVFTLVHNTGHVTLELVCHSLHAVGFELAVSALDHLSLDDIQYSPTG